MRTNLDIFGFTLTDADISAIDALESNGRIGGDPMNAEWTQIR
jgi:2,5-diketo-D-gluconate reductase A